MFAIARARRVHRDGTIRDAGVAGIDDERDIEGCLESRFVEGWEGAASVGGFKLGHGVVASGGLREIEAAQLVIENSGEIDGDDGFAGRQQVGYCEGRLLLARIVGIAVSRLSSVGRTPLRARRRAEHQV